MTTQAIGVVSALRNMGMQCHMVTGDNWRTARIVAAQLGIINVQAEVLPAGKADVVCTLHHLASSPFSLKVFWRPAKEYMSGFSFARSGYPCGDSTASVCWYRCVLCSRLTRRGWPWWVTASMTHPRSCRLMSASPSAQVLNHLELPDTGTLDTHPCAALHALL